MKCEKCGTEIAEGKMYCPSCGNEIQIVPDFEPEVEQKIDQVMTHILKDVFHHVEQKPEHASTKKVQNKSDTSGQEEESLIAQASLSKKHFYRWIVLLIWVSVVILLLVFGYMNFTADYQIRRGNYFVKMQDYTSAIKHYEKAEKLDPENAEINLYLAQCYEEMDKIAGYEASLTKVIQKEEATEAQRNLAYLRLASLYLEKEEYQKINRLLKNCEDEDILNIFGKYCAQTPVFSHAEGAYSEIIPLKIQGGEKGKIYYTVDGSDPTSSGLEYTGPIFLDKGDHVIKAIYVNEFGVTSDITAAKFTVKF